MEFLAGALAAALVAAVVALVAQRDAHKRSVQQIDAVLARVSTEPRLELRPAASSTKPTTERTYIADHPSDDDAWNEYRGEEGGDE